VSPLGWFLAGVVCSLAPSFVTFWLIVRADHKENER
jgi:hypothetical protein